MICTAYLQLLYFKYYVFFLVSKTNLKINYVKRESNHVKLIEFRRTKIKNPNEWFEKYNIITKANK